MISTRFIHIGLLLCSSLLFFECKTESVSQVRVSETPQIPVFEVSSVDTVLMKEYVADIQAAQNVELRARVQGFLEEILIDEGHFVKKGQVLFKTNQEEYQAELAKANANLESAIAEAKALEYEVDRLRVMVDNNVISESELKVTLARHNAVLAKIEEAKSAEKNAAVQLSYTEIKAPFDGIIDRLPFKVGSLIAQGNLLTTVSDISSIHVYFNVSEREYLEYMRGERKENSSVKLVLADGSPYPFEGKIETMEGEFNAGTGAIAFRAKFPNPRSILKHGATGKVLLTQKIKDAKLIPQKSVFEIQDRTYVYILDEDGKVRMKSFSPHSRFSHYYIVREGLEEGDKLVYEGIQLVKEGMTILPNLVNLQEENIQTLSQEGI